LIILIPVEYAGQSDGKEKKQAELREKALEASYDEYKELTAAWRTLDTKAQGNITIAGIFIAATFAYLTKFNAPGLGEKVLLLFTITFLVLCVSLSLITLLVREVPPHYLGGFMRRMVEDLEQTTEEAFREYLPTFYQLQANLWSSTSKELIRANKVKGELLWVSQGSLLFAIFWAAMLVALKIFS
jgi:hypothetical protein